MSEKKKVCKICDATFGRDDENCPNSINHPKSTMTTKNNLKGLDKNDKDEEDEEID